MRKLLIAKIILSLGSVGVAYGIIQQGNPTCTQTVSNGYVSVACPVTGMHIEQDSSAPIKPATHEIHPRITWRAIKRGLHHLCRY